MWYRQGAEKHVLMVAMGFVEVLPDSVSVLAQVAERAEDLDEARAEAGMKRAEEVLSVAPHEIDFERARLAMLRTLAADAGGKAGIEAVADTVFRNLATLFRYRGLIQTLVVRDLKARYRGSVLGFFWSFFNPLMLLLIYTFVFTKVMPGTPSARDGAVRAVHVLRHPAVDLVLVIAARIVEHADCGREPDQESAVSRGSAADRHRAGEHGALLPRAADPGGVSDLLPALGRRGRACSGSR